MAFVREIGSNGVLYSGIWQRHEVSNRYIGKSIAINRIGKKGISMTSLHPRNWATIIILQNS